MHRGTWKAGERRVAAFFGTLRTSLSGGNSKITRSDTMHGELFIEVKHRKKNSVRTLHDTVKEQAKAEMKIPVLAFLDTNRPGFLLVIHSDDFPSVVESFFHVEKETDHDRDQRHNQANEIEED